MGNSYYILTCFAVPIAVAYLCLIIYQIWGFTRRVNCDNTNINESEKGVSIIIPFRNEAELLDDLISDLENLTLEKHQLEIIWVDDHSEDDGVQIIREKSTLDQQVVPSTGTGKKSAIHTGIAAAKFDIVATLDADVSISKGWLLELVTFFAHQNNNFLILPVITKNEKGVWGNFEALDVLSLTGTTLSWAKMQSPILCNGANLAFRKSLYHKYRQNNSDQNLASGDDLFFLHEVKKNERKSIGYLSSEASVATVDTFNNFRKLINQRARWISKTAFYQDRQTTLVAGIVFLNYILIVLIGVGGLLNPPLIKLFLILFCSKFIIDFLYLFLLARKFNKLKILPWYPLSAVLQFIFVPIVFLASKLVPFEWKGRKYTR